MRVVRRVQRAIRAIPNRKGVDFLAITISSGSAHSSTDAHRRGVLLANVVQKSTNGTHHVDRKLFTDSSQRSFDQTSPICTACKMAVVIRSTRQTRTSIGQAHVSDGGRLRSNALERQMLGMPR